MTLNSGARGHEREKMSPCQGLKGGGPFMGPDFRGKKNLGWTEPKHGQNRWKCNKWPLWDLISRKTSIRESYISSMRGWTKASHVHRGTQPGISEKALFI